MFAGNTASNSRIRQSPSKRIRRGNTDTHRGEQLQNTGEIDQLHAIRNRERQHLRHLFVLMKWPRPVKAKNSVSPMRARVVDARLSTGIHRPARVSSMNGATSSRNMNSSCMTSASCEVPAKRGESHKAWGDALRLRLQHSRAESPAEHLGWGARIYAFTCSAGLKSRPGQVPLGFT